MKKKKQKEGSVVGRVMWWICLLIAIGVFLFAGYKLVSALLEYKQADDEYDNLKKVADITYPDTSDTDDSSEEDPGPVIDFASLKAVNEDVIGWLVVDALDISYPIMQSEDNDYYLHRTTEKTYNFAGSIFLDYENDSDFRDCNSIIYGHNMRNGSMFGTLKQFRNADIYNKSLYFWICTPEKNYRYQIFAAYEASVGGETYTLFKYKGSEFQEWLKKMPTLSEIPCGDFSFDGDEMIATLSTCTGNSSTRFVVQGVCLNETNDAKEAPKKKVTSKKTSKKSNSNENADKDASEDTSTEE